MDIYHASTLNAGIETIKQAINGMTREGVSREALANIDAAVESLERFTAVLPLLIQEYESDHCPECPFSTREVNREPYGDGKVSSVLYTCDVPHNAYKCPRVKACGFLDPSALDAGVSPYLRRQAD